MATLNRWVTIHRQRVEIQDSEPKRNSIKVGTSINQSILLVVLGE